MHVGDQIARKWHQTETIVIGHEKDHVVALSFQSPTANITSFTMKDAISELSSA